MKGVIVCPQPRAAEEGSKILAKGGNAIDAAVATAFVQAILSPHMCGVGGVGLMLVYSAKTKTEVLIDFAGTAGSKATPEMWANKIKMLSADTPVLAGKENQVGHTSVAIPGAVKGLHEALTKYGTMSWREVIEPAIPYAEEGVPIDSQEAASYTAAPRVPGWPTNEELLKASPGYGKIIYKEDGSPYSRGELRVNKDYARTLRRLIDEGADSFYTGSIAREIAQDMARHGGHITAEDLRNYETKTYTPLKGSYRGYEVSVCLPPGCGAMLLGLLNILEGYPLREMDPDGLEYAWLVVQALRAAHSDRVQYLGDIDFVSVPTDMLISKERGDYWRKKIDAGERIEIPKGELMPAHTTHVSVVDEEGNAVSMTHTNVTVGSCVTPGLGFIYNNAMQMFYAMPGLPNSIAPGRAPVTPKTPAMLFQGGKLAMVIGAPGGLEIPNAIARSIINVIDHGMTMQEAVTAPRIACKGGLIELEGRIRADVAEGLRRKHNPVYHAPEGFTSGVGSVYGIRVDSATGRWQAGTDPRGNGGIAFSHK